MSKTSPVPSPKRLKVMVYPYVSIVRPFTLFAPFIGAASGAFIALGSLATRGNIEYLKGIEKYWTNILLGGLMAATLNAASNILNQVCEIEIDRQNKPQRVLPSGQMSPLVALAYAVIMFAISLRIAWSIQPVPNVRHTFWCALCATIATVLYSSKPIYLKSRGWLANITIAIIRGLLLIVAGGSCVASALELEPWFIGSVFMLFLLGAASTKDFADIKGDKAGGLKTLPIIYGPKKASLIIGPFCIFPWLLLPIGAFLPNPLTCEPILRAQPAWLLILGLALAVYGTFIARLMKRIEITSIEGNHPAWKHMYLMMLSAQIGLAISYAF